MIEVLSDENCPKSGYYVYRGHVEPNDFNSCFVTDKAKAGLFISEKSRMPGLGSCNHRIRWVLIE